MTPNRQYEKNPEASDESGSRVFDCYSNSILARGFEVSKKPFPFTNTEEGFESFVSWIYNLAAAHKLTKIMVAIEPTGHYWFAFVAFLKKYDVQVVLVAPQHVKHSKEMDDNTQEKDDRKDPIVIARLIPEGRYLIPYIPEDQLDYKDWFCGHWHIDKRIDKMHFMMRSVEAL